MPSFRRIKDFEYQSFRVVIAERDGWVRAAGYTSTNTLVAAPKIPDRASCWCFELGASGRIRPPPWV